MKKLITVAVIAAVFIPAVSFAYTPWDFNNDGRIDADDYVLIDRQIAKGGPSTPVVAAPVQTSSPAQVVRHSSGCLQSVNGKFTPCYLEILTLMKLLNS